MIGEADKSRLYVGYKQVQRALNEKKAAKAFVAEDCDSHIKDDVKKLAEQSGTELFFVPTMKDLGAMCSIEVGASCAVLLK